MSDPRPICDFFIDRGGVEYLVDVYTQDEGFADDYDMYVLMEDGSKGMSVDAEPFDDEVQRRFWDWCQTRFDDDH